MPRNLTTGMVDALSAQVVRPIVLASIAFATEPLYAWSGLGPLTWNGNTYQGLGDLATVSSVSEGSTIEAMGTVLTLSGIPAANITDAANESRRLMPVKIYLGCLDNTFTLIPDPYLLFQGLTDECKVIDGGDTCTITINVESFLMDLNRPVFRRYTPDDQQLDLAATLTRLGLPSDTVDTGFAFVPTIQEMTIFWGQSPTSSNDV